MVAPASETFLYRDEVGWTFNDYLGENMGWLKNNNTADQIPTSGWMYLDASGTKQFGDLNITHYTKDDHIEVCTQVEIDVKDDAFKAWANSGGLFEWNGKFSAGRQVYQNKETRKYINVK